MDKHIIIMHHLTSAHIEEILSLIDCHKSAPSLGLVSLFSCITGLSTLPKSLNPLVVIQRSSLMATCAMLLT